MAFTQGTGEMTFHGKIQFENGGAPLERDNFAFCKVRTNLVVGVEKVDVWPFSSNLVALMNLAINQRTHSALEFCK